MVDDALADAVRFGIDDDVHAALRARLEDGHEGVWSRNAAAVVAFLTIQTQWRILAGAGGVAWLGLDYAAARVGLEAGGIEVTPALWGDLRVIEAAVVSRMNGGVR